MASFFFGLDDFQEKRNFAENNGKKVNLIFVLVV